MVVEDEDPDAEVRPGGDQDVRLLAGPAGRVPRAQHEDGPAMAVPDGGEEGARDALREADDGVQAGRPGHGDHQHKSPTGPPARDGTGTLVRAPAARLRREPTGGRGHRPGRPDGRGRAQASGASTVQR
ncbi:hypothetical protein GCM10009714_03770 [Microlunatus capsulatus]